jgi:hypothetical protein
MPRIVVIDRRTLMKKHLHVRLAATMLAVAANVISLTPQTSDPIPGYLQQIAAANLSTVATDLVTLYGPRREDAFSPYIDGACTSSGTIYSMSTVDMAADYIKSQFLSMGYPPVSMTVETLPDGAGQNVSVTKIGNTFPDVFIEFGAHYDTVAGSPGGVDNASGTTAVMELARVLKDYPNRYSMRFILFAAEEYSSRRGAAYYGSDIHVQQALARGEQFKAGLVMDLIGFPNPGDPTGYMNDLSYSDAESQRIADLFDQVRTQYGIVIGFRKSLGILSSDEHAYWENGQVAVSSGGGSVYYRPNYHGCGDTVANIDFTNVQRVTAQNLAVGLKLDAEPFGMPAPDDKLRAAYGMDEGSGTTLRDSAGYANTGTLMNAAGWGTGRHGTGLALDGIDDYVSIPNSLGIDLSGSNMTIEFWIDIAPGAASSHVLTKPWIAGAMQYPFYQYAVEYAAGTNQLIFHFGTTGAGPRSFPMSAGASGWRHVAFAYDGASAAMRGYLDGVEQFVGLLPFGLEARGTPLLLGVNGALSSPFRGSLDDLRIYKRPLSPSEIQADMDTPVAAGPPPAITGFSPGAGPVGTAVTITGTGFSGTTMVRFNTTEQAAFTMIDDTTITTTVPAGATSGPIQVVTPTGAGTSATAFGVGSGVPELSINSLSSAEDGTATFTASLSAASGQTVTVAYATANGTAVAGSDYTAASGTLTFGPGVTSQPIAISVLGDLVDEVDETFMVTLGNPTGATLGVATGTATIVDDDLAPTLTVGDASVTEGNTGSVQATFTVTLSAPSGRQVTVAYATASGTAVAGTDYTAANGTVTFAPGVTSQPVNISVLGDVLDEPNETLSVALSTPVHATLSDGNGAGTIKDDDPRPSLAINDVTVAEGNQETVTTFTVTLSAMSGQAVTVNYETGRGTARAGSDYTSASGTLTFAPGTTTATVTVTILGDTTREAIETFEVRLSRAARASIGDGTGVCTILDND